MAGKLKELIIDEVAWKSIKNDGLDIEYSTPIPRALASAIIKELDEKLEYFTGDLAKIRVFGKIYPLPRQQVAYGDPGITYTYSNLTVPALPWPDPVLALRNFIFRLKGIKYNFVLVNKYRNGNDHMGEHRDNEPELDHNVPIASLSFGEERTFVLKHRDARKSGPNKKPIPPVSIALEHGSVLLMNPPTNEFWYHSLPKRKKIRGPRINLTFRKIPYEHFIEVQPRNISSKMPSLRIDQSDLKCKNGCDYFGNPQWQGYCSKCHREQLQRQRRAEKASSTLPKPEQKKPERNFKVTSHSSFSKFEEKRLRQSETLKKANLLKFSVFKKSNTEDHDHVAEKKPAEFKIPAIVNEGMKRDFRLRFPNLTPHIDRDSRLFAHSFIMDVIKHSNILTVDELSERVQRQYQRFMKHMDTSPHFSNVDSDTKELLIDFVEKHSMKYLHELPSVVFSPTGTDDERLDRVMSERIQQLSWVCETHLECKLDRNSASCRQLLYKAISELLGMDAALSPGGKVARVRRACKHVLALCGAPASADDLLPALIFTVLKANPPRLVSNINFVTRFCNAQRLMTGEGGYYFTNLCCAVQFIENLTSESLNMDKKEFDCYMAMPASIGGSAWAAALSLCGASRDAEEQMLQVEKLIAHTKDLKDKADQLANNAETFEKEIAKKVQDVLAKTPLEIKPRRELPRLGSLKTSTSLLVDIDAEKILIEKSLQESTQLGSNESKDNNSAENFAVEIEIPKIEMDNIKNQPTTSFQEEIDRNKFTDTPKIQDEPIITFSQTPEEKSPSKSPINPWELKQTNSLELLTPSPLGFTPFDSRSIDELMTPDDFGSDQVPGLSNVNYDIDLSDLSGDNSLAEDTPREQKDPFSPEPKKFYPFEPRNPFSPILDKFDEFTLIDTKTDQPSDAFEVVHRASSSGDPFSRDINDSFPMEKDGSLLDDSNSPTSTCLLPSPLLPQSSNPN